MCSMSKLETIQNGVGNALVLVLIASIVLLIGTIAVIAIGSYLNPASFVFWVDNLLGLLIASIISIAISAKVLEIMG